MPKRSNNSEEYDKKSKLKKGQNENSEDAIFQGLVIFVSPSGIGKNRLRLFCNRISELGGTSLEKLQEHEDVITHIVFEDSVSEEIVKTTVANSNVFKNSVDIIRSRWLSDCLYEKRLVPVDDKYRIKIPIKMNPKIQENVEVCSDAPVLNPSTSSDSNVIGKEGNSKFIECNEGNPTSINLASSNRFVVKTVINVNKFACARSSMETSAPKNLLVVEKFQALVETYKSTKDHWRAVSYEKAITALKNHPRDITSWEEARSLPGVGDRLADKIWEVVESGRLRKEEELCNSEHAIALQLFMKIWGVGPSTAQLWVQQGFRTLQDLENKANLNKQQRIGLKNFDDFQERMPREEAAQIESKVKQAVFNLLPDAEAVACGSYRRGKSNCGDVDVLVTHADGTSHCGLLPKIVTLLKADGFLTDDLISLEDKEYREHQKYMGVCKLPGINSKHRRLDIIVIPYKEYACALLYFTGSAHFNRSMRLLARKMNMHLSEHSLNAGVTRQGQETLNEGTPLDTPTEESVFKHLGLPYRRPEERDL